MLIDFKNHMLNVQSSGHLAFSFSMAAVSGQMLFKPVMTIPHTGSRQGINPRRFNSELANMGFKVYEVSDV